MNKKLKELYESPTTAIVDVRVEGIICQSGIPDALCAPEDYELGADPFNF